MWGDEYRRYFEIFSTFVVYKVNENGQPDDNGGWWDSNKYKKRIEHELMRPNVTLGGKKFDPAASNSEGVLIDVLINAMSPLIHFKLFERRRQTWPPLLEYRRTRLGKQLYQLGHMGGLFRKLIYRVIFLLFGIYVRALKFKWIIAVAAGAMAALNAVKFLEISLSGISYGVLWIFGVVVTAIAMGVAAVRNIGNG